MADVALRAARRRELLAWALGRLERFRVRGSSMAPAIPDGCTVLLDPRARPGVGDVVVCRHPDHDLLVLKRVHRVEPDGRLFLRGDGEVSTDSRDYGAVSPDALQGVVRCTFP